MTEPIAYLMENDEAKWLGYEPDPQADFVTPLYKEKWKMTKDKTLLDAHAEQVERDCVEVDQAFAESAYQRGYMDGMAKPCPDCADRAAPSTPAAEPVAVVVKCEPYEDGSPNPCNTLEWTGRNCENDLPVGTKLYIHPAAEPVAWMNKSGTVISTKEKALIIENGKLGYPGGEFDLHAKNVERSYTIPLGVING